MTLFSDGVDHLSDGVGVFSDGTENDEVWLLLYLLSARFVQPQWQGYRRQAESEIAI